MTQARATASIERKEEQDYVLSESERKRYFDDLIYTSYAFSEKEIIVNNRFYLQYIDFFKGFLWLTFDDKQTFLDLFKEFTTKYPEHALAVKECLFSHLKKIKKEPFADFIAEVIKVYEKNLSHISDLSKSLDATFDFLRHNRTLYNISSVWKFVYDNPFIAVKHLQGLQNLLNNDQKQHLDFLLKNIDKAHELAAIFKLLKDNYLDGIETLYNKLHCAMDAINDDIVRQLTKLSESKELTEMTFLTTLYETKSLNRLFRPVVEKKYETMSPQHSGFPMNLGRLD